MVFMRFPLNVQNSQLMEMSYDLIQMCKKKKKKKRWKRKEGRGKGRREGEKERRREGHKPAFPDSCLSDILSITFHLGLQLEKVERILGVVQTEEG